MILGPNQSPPFYVIKVLLDYDNNDNYFYIIIYGCFMDELRSCGRNRPTKLKLLIIWPLTEKTLNSWIRENIFTIFPISIKGSLSFLLVLLWPKHSALLLWPTAVALSTPPIYHLVLTFLLEPLPVVISSIQPQSARLFSIASIQVQNDMIHAFNFKKKGRLIFFS